MWVSRAGVVRLVCWTSYLVNRSQEWSTDLKVCRRRAVCSS